MVQASVCLGQNFAGIWFAHIHCMQQEYQSFTFNRNVTAVFHNALVSIMFVIQFVRIIAKTSNHRIAIIAARCQFHFFIISVMIIPIITKTTTIHDGIRFDMEICTFTLCVVSRLLFNDNAHELSKSRNVIQQKCKQKSAFNTIAYRTF